MSEKRMPWAEGRRALVRWCDDGKFGDWREAIGAVQDAGWVGGVAFKCWRSVANDDYFVADDYADTRPLPDHCGTCFLPFGCGCPGDGWGVPVHVRLPDVVAGVTLREVGNPDDLRVPDGKEWRRFGAYYSPGERASPMVPFRNGAPIYLEPWGKM